MKYLTVDIFGCKAGTPIMVSHVEEFFVLNTRHGWGRTLDPATVAILEHAIYNGKPIIEDTEKVQAKKDKPDPAPILYAGQCEHGIPKGQYCWKCDMLDAFTEGELEMRSDVTGNWQPWGYVKGVVPHWIFSRECYRRRPKEDDGKEAR